MPERIFFLQAIALQALLYHWHLSIHLQPQQQLCLRKPLHALVPYQGSFSPPMPIKGSLRHLSYTRKSYEVFKRNY